MMRFIWDQDFFSDTRYMVKNDNAGEKNEEDGMTIRLTNQLTDRREDNTAN